MNENFVWADAWILLALLYAGDSTDRATVSTIADGINHAIPTEEELMGAFARLVRAKFIEEEDGKFTVLPIAKQAYLRTHTPRRAVFKEMEDMQRFLGITTSEGNA